MNHDVQAKPEVDLRAFASQFAAGVAVISTCDAEGKPTGVTMTAVLSLSLNPPLFLISLDNGSNTLNAIDARKSFCINFLTEDQANVSKIFASKGVDKFCDVAHTTGVTGSPCIDGTVAFGECELQDQHIAGDHTILIARVVRTVVNGGEPLVYHGGSYAALNKAA